MTDHTTQAGDWWEARQRGERLPEHELTPDPTCDLCARRVSADDFSEAAGMWICPICLEDLISAHHAQESNCGTI